MPLVPPINRTATGTGTTAPGNMVDELNKVIPGFSNLTSTASGNINDLLSGLPSPSLARNASAYYGVQSGMPGSDYVRNRGFDLYNTQADSRRQQGLQGLLALLQGVSGTATATSGQALQNQQASGQLGLGYADLNQRGGQFNQNLEFQKWLEAQRLGISRGQLGLQAQGTANDTMSTYLNFLR